MVLKQIKDASGSDGNKGVLQPKQPVQISLDIGPPKRWPIILTTSLLAGIAIGGVYTIARVASVFEEVTAIATFIAGSTVGLFTLLAIIAQAAIYWQQRNFMMRQWKAMQDSVDRTDTIIEKMHGQLEAMNEQLEIERAKTNPRLQITSVRVVNLRPDESPIFMMSIRNIGLIDATDSMIDLKVSFGKPIEGTLAKKLINPQTITIPAGQEHTYAIPWNDPITKEHLERLQKIPLTVSGFIKPRNATETEFCYRYYVFKGERPPSVPQFVPCDFDTRLRTVITPETARLRLTTFAPEVVTRPAPAKEDET